MMPESRDNTPRRSIFAVWRWPWWARGLIVPMLILAYPLSFGPACWLAAWSRSPQALGMVSSLYRPIAASVINGPTFYRVPMRASIRVGLPRDVMLDGDPRGIFLVFPTQAYTYTILSL